MQVVPSVALAASVVGAKQTLFAHSRRGMRQEALLNRHRQVGKKLALRRHQKDVALRRDIAQARYSGAEGADLLPTAKAMRSTRRWDRLRLSRRS